MRYASIILILFVLSCRKEKPEEPQELSHLENGIIVLCEGLFQQNNSSLFWIDLANSKVNNQFFLSQNQRQLGDTGNDIERYGNKIYVVVNNSSTIEVLSVLNGRVLKTIEMSNNGQSKQPRSALGVGGKLYVTCYDGYVDVIDTSSFEIQTRIPVGLNPEELTLANDKIYVSNSGGLSFPNADSTVSVIDPNQNVELSKITVGLNPGPIVTDHEGDVYVVSRGDYVGVPSRMHKIDSQTDELSQSFGFDASILEAMNDQLIIGYTDFSGNGSSIGLFDATTESMVNPTFIDASNMTVYRITYSSSLSRIFVSDPLDFTTTGYLRSYDQSGAPVDSYHVGLNPSEILIIE